MQNLLLAGRASSGAKRVWPSYFPSGTKYCLPVCWLVAPACPVLHPFTSRFWPAGSNQLTGSFLHIENYSGYKVHLSNAPCCSGRIDKTATKAQHHVAGLIHPRKIQTQDISALVHSGTSTDSGHTLTRYLSAGTHSVRDRCTNSHFHNDRACFLIPTAGWPRPRMRTSSHITTSASDVNLAVSVSMHSTKSPTSNIIMQFDLTHTRSTRSAQVTHTTCMSSQPCTLTGA